MFQTPQPWIPAESRKRIETIANTHLGGGFGLKGMRERVEALDGTLRVGPTPEGGFEVVAALPTTTP